MLHCQCNIVFFKSRLVRNFHLVYVDLQVGKKIPFTFRTRCKKKENVKLNREKNENVKGKLIIYNRL